MPISVSLTRYVAWNQIQFLSVESTLVFVNPHVRLQDKGMSLVQTSSNVLEYISMIVNTLSHDINVVIVVKPTNRRFGAESCKSLIFESWFLNMQYSKVSNSSTISGRWLLTDSSDCAVSKARGVRHGTPMEPVATSPRGHDWSPMDFGPYEMWWNLKKFPTKPWFRWVFHMGKGLLITPPWQAPHFMGRFHGKPRRPNILVSAKMPDIVPSTSCPTSSKTDSSHIWIRFVCVCLCMHACMHACMDGWMDGWKDVSMYATYNCIYILTHTCVCLPSPDHTKSNFQGTSRIRVRLLLWQADMIFQHIPTNGWVYPRKTSN